MIKLNRLSLMVATALYVGGSASAVAEQSATQQQWATPAADYAPQALALPEYPGVANQQVKVQHKVFTPEPDISGVQTYIVQLEDVPAAIYDGSLKGFAATNTVVQSALNRSKKPLNTSTGALGAYTEYLTQKRDSVIANALRQQGVNVPVMRTFSVTLNGFTTQLTQDEAQRLAKVPGVKHISRSTMKQMFTHSTPIQTGADQVWSGAQGGLGSNMGEGMVIGVIDSGINTDHPAFAAVGDDGYRHINPLGDRYLGDCETTASLCNDKLIGVYSYPEVTHAYSDPVFPESRPPVGEDYNGHGSHVAGTAAGNVIYNQPFMIPEGGVAQGEGIETNLIFEQTSGMAPHANIISYQVCLPGVSGDPYAGCPTAAIIAAVEQSVLDNVDVINLSLGGREEDPWLDPIEQSFYHAAKAGVFVVAAAGNSGDQMYTADHSSPWVTTVGAHSPSSLPIFENKELTALQGGNATPPGTMTGRSVTFEEISGVIVRAQDFPNPNAQPVAATVNCDAPFPAGTFDLEDNPDTLDLDESQADVIVVCKRSSQPLITKSSNVQQGGAEGIIIHNQAPQMDYAPLPFIPHAVPGIHVSFADGQKLNRWLADGAGHYGTITASNVSIMPIEQELVAGFSSRGPSYFGLDTMVVDITAPGVDIFAPSTDDQPFTLRPTPGLWQSLNGTSMASPHVAGAAVLLRQSHPDWSPMQLQSALMMTATNDLENSSILDPYTSYQQKAAFQDMGAGRMNVDRADRVDLTLHEDMASMEGANPSDGGLLKRLNTAYMVDMSCGESCTFMRTFTAERDGSWTTSAEAFSDELDLSVEPASFSLKAGETQSIVVTAKTRSMSNAIDLRMLAGSQGEVKVTSADSQAPVLELPVWTWVGETGLPSYVNVDAHRTSGELSVGPFNTQEIDRLTTRSFGLTKAHQKTVKMFIDPTGGNPFDLDADGELVNHFELLEADDTTQAVMARVTGEDYQRVLVFMGQDLNGDGMPNDDELLCMSTSYSVQNFCSVNAPNEGTYWALYMNLAQLDYGQIDEGRDISIAFATVNSTDAGNLSVMGDTSIPGYENYALRLQYNLPDMKVGDVYFGGFDLGSDGNNAGNIGYVPVTVTQVDEDVTFAVNQQQASPGQFVEFSLSVIANTDEEAKQFAFTAAMPDGIDLVPESVEASHHTPGDYSLADNTFTLVGTQESTRDVVRNYNVTTNLSDEMCSLTAANSPYPGYLDLRSLGWRTIEGLEGSYYNSKEYLFSDLMQTNEKILFPFFGTKLYDSVKISPAGVLHFGQRNLPWVHAELPNSFNGLAMPEDLIAPLWIGDQSVERYDSQHGEDHLNAGVTSTYTYSREWLVLEFDNITRNQQPSSLADFEIFMRMALNYEPGEYEMLFAYNNLNLANGDGSVGLKSFIGRSFIDGDIPVDVSVGHGFAYNDLDTKLHDELVVCLDYTGPEQSKFDVTFMGYINEAAANTTQRVVLENGLQGSTTEELVVEIEVAGNLQLAELQDLTIPENGSAQFTVNYADENSVSNIISLTGDNFSYEVSGHTSGSTVTLTPTPNFHGEIPVTLTVTDSAQASDKATTSFIVTVQSDGVELGCTDTDASNYDPSATSDDGSCQYPAEQSKSSGSFGWLAFGLVALLIPRRRKLKLS